MMDDDYELKEREAILTTDNDVEYHPVHLKNKAAKEIAARQANWEPLQELLKKESE